MELDENSDPESDEGGAEVSFVSNASTLASSTSQKCGFQGCTNLSTNPRDYKLNNGMRAEKAWCSNHKLCSKHHKYESAGKCAYSTQIALRNAPKNNAKVSRLRNQANISNDIQPRLQQTLTHLVVGGDIEESIGFTPFRTDTNHLGTSSLS
jgi:hypothetical protein